MKMKNIVLLVLSAFIVQSLSAVSIRLVNNSGERSNVIIKYGEKGEKSVVADIEEFTDYVFDSTPAFGVQEIMSICWSFQSNASLRYSYSIPSLSDVDKVMIIFMDKKGAMNIQINKGGQEGKIFNEVAQPSNCSK